MSAYIRFALLVCALTVTSFANYQQEVSADATVLACKDCRE